MTIAPTDADRAWAWALLQELYRLTGLRMFRDNDPEVLAAATATLIAVRAEEREAERARMKREANAIAERYRKDAKNSFAASDAPMHSQLIACAGAIHEAISAMETKP